MSVFHGIWPALVTPFAQDGSVNGAVLRRLVSYLLERGVDGFYVCGSTGEGLLMSVAERQLVLETVVEAAGGRVPVIAHVGAVALVDACALARHARDAGAAGVSSVLLPQYPDVRTLTAYLRALAAAVPEMPVFAYLLNSSLDNTAFMRQLMEIPNLAGAKYTGPDVYEFGRIVRLRQTNWTLFSGMDEVCLYAAMQGAHGSIGSTLNFMPGVYRAIHSCVRCADLETGQKLQSRANEIITLMSSAGFMGALKQVVLPLLGFDCGAPRLPHAPFPLERAGSLRAELETAKLSELAAL